MSTDDSTVDTQDSTSSDPGRGAAPENELGKTVITKESEPSHGFLSFLLGLEIEATPETKEKFRAIAEKLRKCEEKIAEICISQIGKSQAAITAVAKTLEKVVLHCDASFEASEVKEYLYEHGSATVINGKKVVCMLCLLCLTSPDVSLNDLEPDYKEMVDGSSKSDIRRVVTVLALVIALKHIGGSCKEERKFKFIRNLIDKLLTTEDIRNGLEGLKLDKETVPNNKFGKYALLIASTDSQEKRSWEKSSFPLKLCLYASKCFQKRYDVFKFVDLDPPLIFAPGIQLPNFEWSCNNVTTRTVLKDGAFEYSKDINELASFVEAIDPNLVVEMPSFGSLLSFNEAKNIARTFDKVPGKTENTNWEAEVEARLQSVQPLAFDEFRKNGYARWGVWVLHVLLHSDRGKRFGDYYGVLKNMKHLLDSGISPCTKTTARLWLKRKSGVSPPGRRCPGCRLQTCSLFSSPGIPWLANYSSMDDRSMDDSESTDASSSESEAEQSSRDDESNEDTGDFCDGQMFRYRSYRRFAKAFKYKKRARLPACVTLCIKLMYPGGPLKGFEELAEESNNYRYGEIT